MISNYARIIRDNLDLIYGEGNGRLPGLEKRLPAIREQDCFLFRAFGENCRLTPGGIFLEEETVNDPRGIIVSLYARFAADRPCVSEPWKAYKEFSGTMPYAAAFHTHTEQILVPHAEEVMAQKPVITADLDGGEAPGSIGGDCAFTVSPLPKIRLCYILYEADEDFPAAVTCLYSANADTFLPTDALADVGEYTSRKILTMIGRAA
ncbi:MAG: DUF3786 domain-containing protein [Desulfosudaceae bacterium]